VWGHGLSKRESALRSVPRRAAAQLADAALFYTRGAADRWVGQWRWDPRRVFVAPNSLDQGPIQAARRHWLDRPGELAEFRRRHGLEKGPVVLFVARLDAGRRVDLLLEAAVRMRPAYPGLRIVVIGAGPAEDDLRAQAQRLGLSESVHFAGAIYDEMQLAPWFLSATAMCFPANIGLSLLHAFGYGLPVVTSDRRQAHGPEIEALRDGGNGLLCGDGDAGSLAEALRRIADDPALRQRLSGEALRTVDEQYTLGNMVDGLEAAIRFAAGRVRSAD